MENEDYLRLEFGEPEKNTKRCRRKSETVIDGSRVVVVEKAESKDQIFYLKRSVEFHKIFSDLGFPVLQNNLHIRKLKGRYYLSYEKNLSLDKTTISEAKKISSDFGVCNDDSLKIDHSLTKLLETWPEMWRLLLSFTKEFRAYKSELTHGNYNRFCLEHGDFTINNVLVCNGRTSLIDFEFSREYQPLGFDYYDFKRSVGSNDFSDIENYELNRLKYEFIECANFIYDGNIKAIVIDDFSPELKVQWDALILRKNTKCNYSNDFQWCKSWWERFSTGKQLFIVASFKGEVIDGILPLYKEKNYLKCIGSYPDLYDSLDILYENESALIRIIEFVLQGPYTLDFRWVPASSSAIYYLRHCSNKRNLYIKASIDDEIPYIESLEDQYKMPKKLHQDVMRCISKIERDYSELEFRYEDLSNDVLDVLINLHIKRWNGGPFKDILGFRDFVDTVLRSQLATVSTLSLNGQIIAAHLAYKNSDGSVTSAIPAYDIDYAIYSPGKILLYMLICEVQKRDLDFDFGRGDEDYKRWFTSSSVSLCNVRVFKSGKIIDLFNLMLGRLELYIEKAINFRVSGNWPRFSKDK
jgi:hypothetical protein